MNQTSGSTLSRLKGLKPFFSVNEAASVLSGHFGEEVTPQNIYEFVLGGHLVLSVRIVDPLLAEKIEIIREK
ncbi:hypothetical protein [Enterobacter vonholyi]|uniref:hypothetical protein n=1 Tax=Enterobacter vonholyi TaxID=2797505 RepID=UPI0011EDA040|nr:hypothetical protein [Enterobacter vonholyi]KAA0509696.1 hypothetical protein F0319_20230 [Enterobacter vonholyi]